MKRKTIKAYTNRCGQQRPEVELMHLSYEGKNMISELAVLAMYKDGSKKDITSNINKFLYV